MKFISLQNLSKNTQVNASFKVPFDSKSIKIGCSSFFSVYADNKLIFYGPERSPEGYVRISTIYIPRKVKEITINILYYGIPTFDLDEQQFYFGIEVLNDNNVLLDAHSLSFFKDNSYISESIRYSFQRGFVERFDLTNNHLTKLKTLDIKSPIELQSNSLICSYNEEQSVLIKEGIFNGLITSNDRKYLEITKSDNSFDFDKEFLVKTKKGYKFKLYKLEGNRSGLIKLLINKGLVGDKAYIYFDECLINDQIVYGRGTVTNIIEVTLNSSKECIITNCVYCAQYFMIIYPNDADIVPSLISIQNENVINYKITNKENINLILEASKNTYMQNTYDIYTDCPGRERAGWLCDSYFMGLGEKYFSKSNNIEKHFLENFIVGKCPEIHNDDIVPMCFPSSHTDGTFIPNWALWFILEIDRYYRDTKDDEMLNNAKSKILSILSFMQKYENEFGLLENLPSWVFIEWSEAGSDEYVKGISFPTNMTYASSLIKTGNLYNLQNLIEKGKKLIKTINKLSFDGNFYHDNAIRDDKNNIQILLNHTSETAQYYAIFFKINEDCKFINKMINEFSSIKKINENGMPKSNVFIGNFLRFLILLENKEYKRLLDEIIPYFSPMAKKTNTLWEKDTDDASCNHGLNAAIAPIISECLKNI